jgi:hypothetical protein
MQVRYALEWLDTLIMVSLNPERTNLCGITAEEAQQVISKLSVEKDRLQLFLSTQVSSVPDLPPGQFWQG